MGNNPSDTGEEDTFISKVRDILMESKNCAQTSFVVIQEEFNLEGDQVLKALTPFPGIALRGETCGAVIGCLMAIGLKFGREDLNDLRGYFRSLPAARCFCSRFEEKNGSIDCASILEEKLGRKYNLADRADALEYSSSGGPEVCGEVVASAVQIASEVIRKTR